MPLKYVRVFCCLQVEAQFKRFLQFRKERFHIFVRNIVLGREIPLHGFELIFFTLFLLVLKLDRLENGSSDEKVDEK